MIATELGIPLVTFVFLIVTYMMMFFVGYQQGRNKERVVWRRRLNHRRCSDIEQLHRNGLHIVDYSDAD